MRRALNQHSTSNESQVQQGARDEAMGLTNVFSRFVGLSSRQKAIVIVVIFAVVGVVANYMARAAVIVNEETVLLSNGISIRLGEPIKIVSAKLGGSLYKLSEKQYEYPGHPNRPIEVVLDVENGKVVVIHIVNNNSNELNAANGALGTSLRQLTAKNQRAKPVTGDLLKLRELAVTVEQTRSRQYYIPEPCATVDSTNLVTLALKGYEHRVIEDMGGATCGRD